MRLQLLWLVLFQVSAVVSLHSFNINGEQVLALKTFAFRANGVAHIELYDVSFNPPVKDANDKFGFMLVNLRSRSHSFASEQLIESMYKSKANFCPYTDIKKKFEKSYNTNSSFFRNFIFFPMYDSQIPSSAVDITEPGYYTLVFYRCTPSLVTAKVNYELLNVYNGKQREIDAGEEHVGLLNFFFSIIFFGLGVVWFGLMVRNRQGVHAIHWMMLGLCILKSMELMSWSMFYWLTKHNFPHNFVRYISWFLVSIRTCFLFMLIALLGSGWSLFTPVLTKNRKRVLLTVVSLQLIVNFIHPFVIDEIVGAANSVMWEAILDLFDIACCCAVLLPAIWSIQKLENTAEDDEKAATHLSRLRKFRSFYIVTILYIYTTRLLVPFVIDQVDFGKEWIHPLIENCVAFLYYLFAGISFRPLRDNQYMTLVMEENEKFNEPHEDL